MRRVALIGIVALIVGSVAWWLARATQKHTQPIESSVAAHGIVDQSEPLHHLDPVVEHETRSEVEVAASIAAPNQPSNRGVLYGSVDDDEALVLFEWIARHAEHGFQSCEHGSEATVLCSLEAQLEKALAAPFEPDYEHLLAQARGRIVPFPLGPR